MKSTFDISYEKLIKHEGGYVFDRTDRGGETYKGIARNFNLYWAGWLIIDKAKESESFPKNLLANEELEQLVKEFYHKNYWEVLNLDSYPEIIAVEIFEEAVNCGIKQAVRFMQNTVNILNNNQKYYPDVNVDGVFGDITKEAFKKCLERHGERLVSNVLNIFQGAFYLELMIKNKDYEKYIGWFKRVEVNNGNI